MFTIYSSITSSICVRNIKHLKSSIFIIELTFLIRMTLTPPKIILYYLSRLVLSYGLKSILENSDTPITLNITGTGMNGNVNWDDLQSILTF